MTSSTPRQPTLPSSRGSRCARDGRGFTLIELLVVVSIIAILIGIIIPVLGIARASALETICQANQRNIMPAWHSFIAERRRFPNYENVTRPNQRPPIGNGWGGTSPKVRGIYGDAAAMRDRPLNEYMSLENATRARLEVFRCPLDNGAKDGGVTSLREADGNAAEYVDDDGTDDSMYFLRGNSYYANDWIWANVGAIDGSGPRGAPPRWNHFNVPDQVLAYPSDTMAIADGGAAYGISMTQAQRVAISVPIGWWHGENKSNIAMWDGSAKAVTGQLGGASPEFNRWLIPEKHAPEGTPIALFGYLRNPDLADDGQSQ
jgi:prepilin-type N-terminal cleavage/methylation domain-containing protein/prepilin-type processing-associated H-X9-DG protein